MPERTRRILTALALGTFAVTLIVAGVFFGRPLWRIFTNPELMQATIHRWGAWGPLGLVVLQVLQIVIAPLPGNIVALIGGYVFGLGSGITLIMAGIVVGATVAFIISRLVGRRLLTVLISEELMRRFDTFVCRRGPFYVFLLLLVPNPVGDWMYYLAGFTVLPWPVFVLLVLVARLPSNLIEVLLGVQMFRLGSLGRHLAWWQWVLFLGFFGVLGVVYFLNRKRIEDISMRFVKFPVDDEGADPGKQPKPNPTQGKDAGAD